MTLRDILSCSIPDEPGYQAPRAKQPLDAAVDVFVPSRLSSSVNNPLPVMTYVVRAVNALGIASVADVGAWIEAQPEARFAGRMDAKRLQPALTRAAGQGLIAKMIGSKNYRSVK